jgi:D-alanine-D-alanine ligase
MMFIAFADKDNLKAGKIYCYFCRKDLIHMKQNIAIVSGGDSGEYDISVQSGEVVKKYLQSEKFEVFPILMKGQDWIYTCNHGNSYEVDKNDFSLPMIAEKVYFDCVFIAIHGTPGEDGKLQGYFDMLGIPYTSSNHVVSALTFNKYLCKLAVSAFDTKVANAVFLRKNEPDSVQKILSALSLPVFIKPNNGGSSVGMSKVKHAGELSLALSHAFKEDLEVLAEEFIDGREITCGVLTCKNQIISLPITEVISKKDFFDFEAKYDPALADEIVPAQIPEEVSINCQQTSAVLYQKLGCQGVVRFDYIFNDDGLYFLEVNTVPGMTEASIVPKMAEAYGWTLQKLFTTLVEEALSKR